MKTAFIFPGQGSQYVGMAKDLYEEFASVREMFEKASEILKFDLASVCFAGPEETLKKTICTQPAIFIHSCALDMILKENFIIPSAAAGHSLGEYSALVSAGALAFEPGIEAIAKRSAAMQEDCERASGAMAAIVGLKYEDVVELLVGIEGVVVPANYNSPDQVVIAGDRDAVNAACARLKEAGAKRAITLPVAGAYHSPLMTTSSELTGIYISGMPLGQFKCPVYSNVSGEPVSEPVAFKELLSRQILSPVLWSPLVMNMYRDGVRRFVEVGPGKVLQGLVKRILDDVEIEIEGVDTLDSLDEFMNKNSRVESR